MSFPKRKHPWQGVLESEDRPTIVFLTVCTAARTSWLADQPIHETLKSIWRTATYWKVGPYVLMPDHLHLFAWPGILHAPFDPWVRYWNHSSRTLLKTDLFAGSRTVFIIGFGPARARKPNAFIWSTILCEQASSPDRKNGLSTGKYSKANHGGERDGG